MAEEFEESEVMFQVEVVEQPQKQVGNDDAKANKRKSMMKKKTTLKNSSLSVPMNIPDGNHWFNYVDNEVSGEDYRGGAELVPPHLIIGHRVAGKMVPFSVCTGNGRTLKGRDLRQVRNEILRMTGFLET